MSSTKTQSAAKSAGLISIRGASTHNLQNVDLDIPHGRVTVITGVSGSGKSSLAIDTLYAEGQRQYIESLSTYARQFLNQIQRADVELVEGLPPTLCIDQKSFSNSPRSTVATITEIADYLRLLMARCGTPHCYGCGKPIEQQSAAQIRAEILALGEGSRLVLMAPVVRGRKGQHRDAINEIRKAGLVKAQVDGEMFDVDSIPELSTRRNHTIEAVVDKIVIRDGCEERLESSLDVALKLASGLASISYQVSHSDGTRDARWQQRLFSTLYSCAHCGISYEEVEPRTFSFNSPYGACQACNGVGSQDGFAPELLSRSRDVGEPKPTGKNRGKALASAAPEFIEQAPPALKKKLLAALQPALEDVAIGDVAEIGKLTKAKANKFWWGSAKSEQRGALVAIEALFNECNAKHQQFLASYRSTVPCFDCKGARLRAEALSVTLNGKNIHEIARMSSGDLAAWLSSVEFGIDKQPIATPIVAEMMHRLRFMQEVGVSYLDLARSADSLSGGELQRVRLATSIGSGLVGVCYVLDEPSIGLHQHDNDRLIGSLRRLQEAGNTVVVVEHDESMMKAADLLVDVGPGAGTRGGNIVCAGSPHEVTEHPSSITAQFLRGERQVRLERSKRERNRRQQIKLKGATLHNLQSVNVDIPLGLLVGVSGVSGSGKSSLIAQTLVPALRSVLSSVKGDGAAALPGHLKSLSGYESIDRLVEISQQPIGRNSRSTPATYCGVWDLIRNVWASTRESKQRGYGSNRFSFNAGDGRCAVCQGLGEEKIEMNFLPDLSVPCSTCSAKRFNRQTLQVRFREKSIADVLEMTIDDALAFFENFSKIARILGSLEQVGLGYLRLGQSASTLSGGEAQRLKLAAELARVDAGSSIYFLDEPTTGLHSADVLRLMHVLDNLVERGNTVVVIEHNIDVLQCCDWLVDMGPGGGQSGGRLVAQGPPSAIASVSESLTGPYLSADP